MTNNVINRLKTDTAIRGKDQNMYLDTFFVIGSVIFCSSLSSFAINLGIFVVVVNIHHHSLLDCLNDMVSHIYYSMTWCHFSIQILRIMRQNCEQNYALRFVIILV